MSIDLVVFDMAGTTVHDGDAVHACLQAALGAAGIRVDRQAINAVMGLPKPRAIRALAQADAQGAEVSDRLVELLHQDFVRRMLGHYRCDPSVREVAGARQVFEELRSRGIKVALDTGFNRQIVDVILARLGWGERLVDATVASDEVARGRPHPDLVWRAMELTGVTDRSHVAKVGDTPADLQEGFAAGCGLIVGVTEGSHVADELRPWPHTHLVPNVSALPALIAAPAGRAS
jgi:phosphonatase-like hydrolase